MSTRLTPTDAYDGTVTNDPPAGEPEQRWQQPSFGQQPPPDDGGYPRYGADASAPVPRPAYPIARRVPPPSAFETVISALSRVVWPIAILLFFITPLGFFQLIIVAMVANIVLGSIRKGLRQRRQAAALPPAPPAPPSDPDDLR